jgi:hypothetical protein
MTNEYQRNDLKSSQCIPEHEDQVIDVEVAAFKVRYRLVQANGTMAKSVLSTLLVCQ